MTQAEFLNERTEFLISIIGIAVREFSVSKSYNVILKIDNEIRYSSRELIDVSRFNLSPEAAYEFVLYEGEFSNRDGVLFWKKRMKSNEESEVTKAQVASTFIQEILKEIIKSGIANSVRTKKVLLEQAQLEQVKREAVRTNVLDGDSC